MKKLLVIVCAFALLVSVGVGGMSLASAAGDTEKATISWMASFSDLGAWNTSIHDTNQPMEQPMSNPTPHVRAKDISEDGYGVTLYPGTKDLGALCGLQFAADFDTYTTLYVKGVYKGSKDTFRFGLHNGKKLNSNFGTVPKNVWLYGNVKDAIQEDGSFELAVDLSASLDKDRVWLQIGWFLDQSNNSSVQLDYIALGTRTENADVLAAAIAAYKEAPHKDALQLPANGQVGWVADFSRANWDNWSSDMHENLNNPNFCGTLYGAALVMDPADVSEDGLSATLQDKASDIPGLMGYPIKADFAVYNRLIVKGTYTGDFKNFRMAIHNGTYVTSNWEGTAGPPTAKRSLQDSLELNEDGTFFWVIDVGADFAASDHMWVNFGWWLDKTSKIRIDYMTLTANTVTDDATAAAAIEKYLAGEQYEAPAPISSVSDSKTFEAAVDTEQAFISGAMRIELSASDFAKLQAAQNEVVLTDGTHSLKWDLADYTLVEGKVNTLLLPFNEAINAVIFSNDDTKLDLAAVTGVSVSARDYEGELTVKIGKVDFVNFNELLDSIGIVFYDSCNVPSTIFHGVVEGEKGGAYKLSNDVDPCEYTHKQLPSWAQRFGALGETFSLNASSRKNLDVALRVKFSGNYARLQLGLTSYSSDGSYADQNWRINFTQDDSIYDFSDGEWHTISSADEEDEDAWSFGGDNVCDLTRLLNMRLLGFRNPVTGPANTGSVLVDYMMITDRTRYEGMDNLYLYATADADGSGYVCYYDTTGGDDPIESNPTESDPTESDPAESNPAESNPAESDPTESNPAESDPTESDPAESNPDTGAALPLTAFVLLTAAAGAVVCCRKKK